MTPFDEVIDLALTAVDDYKLSKLYELNKDNFQTFCDGLLRRAIPNFTRCYKSLDYNVLNRMFYFTLDEMEKSILADYWVIEWWTRELQNSRQFQLKLKTSSAFNQNSEAQNLKEKASYLDRLMENVEQKITNYQIRHLSMREQNGS